MGQMTPPRGSKESWVQFTGDYAGSATRLEAAAKSQDKNGALAVHEELTKSCQACHKQHRGGRGGM
jgi:cytochrome c556